jgi:tRNA (guanine10-N2)-methyltransferase
VYPCSFVETSSSVVLHDPLTSALQTPFAIIAIQDAEDATAAAKALIGRSIMASAVFELWGHGDDYNALHADIRHRTEDLWPMYQEASFRFDMDAFHGSHTHTQRRDIMESLAYMAFRGQIVMSTPQNKFTIFEDYELNGKKPHRVLFGRYLADGGRKAITKYTLKKRSYIATTSMDAELSLVTANMALSAPGKLAYDPFMGTGSFPLSCAHFGSTVFGSDLDGRSVRGKKGRNVVGNFEQYNISQLYLGGLTADLTNTPLHARRYLDAIVCDPPYGVREGLKVLGHVKERLQHEVILANGKLAHLQDDYVPPKRPYSFLRMLDDILDFSASMLVDGGRLCMWMPVAGAPDEADPAAEDPEKEDQETEEYAIPQHPALEVVSECTQYFNKCMCRSLDSHETEG